MICHYTEMDEGGTLFSSCFGALLNPYLINLYSLLWGCLTSCFLGESGQSFGYRSLCSDIISCCKPVGKIKLISSDQASSRMSLELGETLGNPENAALPENLLKYGLVISCVLNHSRQLYSEVPYLQIEEF